MTVVYPLRDTARQIYQSGVKGNPVDIPARPATAFPEASNAIRDACLHGLLN